MIHRLFHRHVGVSDGGIGERPAKILSSPRVPSRMRNFRDPPKKKFFCHLNDA